MAGRVYILIGPKGAGKTFLGRAIEKEFQIPFLEVESIALRVKQERAFDNADYVREIFKAIETAVRDELSKTTELLFDSTGLSDEFDEMLANLRADFDLRLIRIRADPDVCLERVRARDASGQVPVSESDIRKINSLALKKEFVFFGELDNLPGRDLKSTLADFKKLRA